MTEELLKEAFMYCLHGSGWDGEWEVHETSNKNFVCTIGYHAMDEHGCYDGWFDVKVHLKRNFEEFKIKFTASQYHRRKYLWDKDYYFDTVNNILDDVKNYVDRKIAAM